MRQNLGLSAIIIALVFAMRSGPPSQNPGGQPAPTEKPNAPPAGTGSSETEGPWLATRAFFHSPEAKSAAPNGTDLSDPASVQMCSAEDACRSQLAKYFGISAASQLQFLIATVPDPLHSRVSLLTDESIQAIQEGADASDWVFASQWLPWIDEADPEEKDPEQRRAQREAVRRQERQPGILVFRRRAFRTANLPFASLPFSDNALIVFVVGETPTAGLNAAQFQLARAYMRAIREPTGEVRILGPTFSGSFYGLAGLLEEDEKQKPGASLLKYRIRSGTVTGAPDAGSFLTGLEDAAQGRYEVDFRSATASTDDQDRYFRSVLVDLGISEDRAASIVEDETAYGNTATDVTARKDNREPGSPIRVYRFPRDISRLRNVYRQSVTTSSTSDNSPPPDVQFSLKDPEKGEDSIPVFSGSQSPLSQYGIVDRIAAAIRRDNIRIVQISATNVLDMLFLAEFLKRQCPDTRLLVNYPDVLLAQAERTAPLAGTLILASYPPFAAANAFMGGRQADQPVTFPDANAESVYNAAVLLLCADCTDLPERLADYHWRTLPHPPTWLLTLDHQGFLPVDVFPHSVSDEKTEKWFQQVCRGAKDQKSFPQGCPDGKWQEVRLPVPPVIWRVSAVCCTLVALALGAWIVWISANPKSEVDARFSLLEINNESGWRRYYLFAFLLFLLLAELIILVPGFQPDVPVEFLVPALFGCVGIAAIAAIIPAMVKPPLAVRISLWVTVLIAALCLTLWLIACFSSPDRAVFFAFRARELRFGSSPTLPIAAALGALVLFAFVHLTRFYLEACKKPDVLTEGLSTVLEERLHDAAERFKASLESPCGLRFATPGTSRYGPRAFAAGLAIVAVAAGCLFRVDRQVRSIDAWPYNALALLVQFLVTAFLLLTCANIRSLWRSLQQFLGSLAALPIARSFRPVDRSGADRPLWVRRFILQSVDVHIEAIYTLHNMTLAAKDALAADPSHSDYFLSIQNASRSYSSVIKELLKVDRKRYRGDTLRLTQALKDDNMAIAKEAFEFLCDSWKTTPLAGPAPVDDKDGAETGEGGKADASEPVPDALGQMQGLAERFVALHYSSFLLYGVHQIQNLLLFLSSGFVLLMISLDCYSVQAPRFVGRLLLLLFLIIGTAVVSCLAGLERDPILSRMAGSKPGKLNLDFYLKIGAYGALPLISLLASQFPSISNFLLSWVEPTLQAFK